MGDMVYSVNDRLISLKKQIEEGKTQKARASANLETYTKQLEDIKLEIKALGVEPTVEALDAEIKKLDVEIESKLLRAEELLSGDFVVEIVGENVTVSPSTVE